MDVRGQQAAHTGGRMTTEKRKAQNRVAQQARRKRLKDSGLRPVEFYVDALGAEMLKTTYAEWIKQQ